MAERLSFGIGPLVRGVVLLAAGGKASDPLDKLRRCSLGCLEYGQCKANMHGRPSECAAGVPPSDAPNTEALQWAVKMLRFLLLKHGGEPVGPHAEFEKAVAALGVAIPDRKTF